MPFFVEIMFSEWADVGICLVIAFVVNAFEHVRVRFILFHLKPWQVDFEVCLTAPHKFSVMFGFV